MPKMNEASHDCKRLRCTRRCCAGRAEQHRFRQADQHTGYDRTVNLNFDAVVRPAQQMVAAQHVFEETEEDLNRPAITKIRTMVSAGTSV